MQETPIGQVKPGATEGTIRRFRLADAEVVSALICNTLLISNSGDYELEAVNNLARGFSPRAIRSMSRRRQIWVYEEDGRVMATIAIEDETISGFFVAPDRQGQGVGRRLMRFIEEKAREKGLQAIRLSASVTAVGFYEKLGYSASGDEGVDDACGRVVPMRKPL